VSETEVSDTPLTDLPTRDCALCPRLAGFRDTQRAAHPDWMAAVRAPLPASLRLEEGDF